jgi:uncharacterized membrane protein YdjX (TVP38/TMEM64 family)
MCGAGRVPFASYMVGTLIGVVPVVAALAWLGSVLRQALLQPSFPNAVATIGAAGLLFVLASGLRTFLLIRQFAPAVHGHRDRAEFG